jgi:hypothetical protein
MPVSRRSAIAAALGLAGATATAATPPAATPIKGAVGAPATSTPTVTPKPFYTARSWPMLPCSLPNLTPAEAKKYESRYFWAVENESAEALGFLAIAKAWYRAYPAAVTSEALPAEIAWAVREEDPEAHYSQFGTLAGSDFLEYCREFAEFVIGEDRKRAAQG